MVSWVVPLLGTVTGWPLTVRFALEGALALDEAGTLSVEVALRLDCLGCVPLVFCSVRVDVSEVAGACAGELL